MGKKYLFGWTNIKWLIKEFTKQYSDEKSYFSKKRVESGIAFLIGQWGMIYYIYVNIDNLTSSDIALWAGIEFALAGYLINQIKKEKKPEEPTQDI